MTDYWNHYRQLAALLSPYPNPNAAVDNWQQVISLANDHWVTPALHKVIPNAPQAVIDYVQGMKTLNDQRNQAHLIAIAEIIDAMATLNIEPIWLKGAAAILTGIYSDSGDRIVGDLDVLFAPEQVNAAKQCFQQLGYVHFPGKDKQMSTHHLPRVYHPISGVTIELHVRVISRLSPNVLPIVKALQDRKQHSWRGRSIFTLSDTHRIIHNIVHLQRDATRHSLRQLREFALMQIQFGHTISWFEIREVFCKANFIEGYLDHLALSQHLFNSPAYFSQKEAEYAHHRLRYNFKNSFPIILPASFIKRTLNVALVCATIVAHDPLRVFEVFSVKKWRENIPSISRRIWIGSK